MSMEEHGRAHGRPLGALRSRSPRVKTPTLEQAADLIRGGDRARRCGMPEVRLHFAVGDGEKGRDHEANQQGHE